MHIFPCSSSIYAVSNMFRDSDSPDFWRQRFFHIFFTFYRVVYSHDFWRLIDWNCDAPIGKNWCACAQPNAICSSTKEIDLALRAGGRITSISIFAKKNVATTLLCRKVSAPNKTENFSQNIHYWFYILFVSYRLKILMLFISNSTFCCAGCAYWWCPRKNRPHLVLI